MKALKELHGAVVLSEKELRKILRKIGWEKIIEEIAQTFIEESNGRVISPPKTIIHIPEFKNDYRVMPAYRKDYPDYCGTKIICCCDLNPEMGMPLAMGTYILNYAPTQKPLLICDATILTAYRTAAATAVAVRELSRPDASSLGIIGCGQQSYFHIPAIKTIRNIKEILVADLSGVAENNLMNKFKKAKRAGEKEIFEKCDIVVTLTPSIRPHLFSENIPDKKMLICAVGGDNENKIEFEPKILNRADHFCDSYDQALHTGLVSAALEEGWLNLIDLKSLGDYMTNKVELNEKQIKMFLSTGVALEDLALAVLIYNNINDKRIVEDI